MSILTLSNLAKSTKLETLPIESNIYIIDECKEVVNSLKSINKDIVKPEVSMIPIYRANESYYINLEDLYSIAETYDETLKDSMTLIKESNNLNVEDNVSAIIAANITNVSSLDDFCDMCEELHEAGIPIAWTKEMNAEEFVTEASISEMFKNVKDKISDKFKKMQASSIEKSISNIEKDNDKLKEELAKFKKLSEEEQKKYAAKKFAKDVIIIGASTAIPVSSDILASGINAMAVSFGTKYSLAVVGSFLLGAPIGNIIGKTLSRSGFGSPKKYIKVLNNSIKINNATITGLKNALKAKK